jgi:hypothetical protein
MQLTPFKRKLLIRKTYTGKKCVVDGIECNMLGKIVVTPRRADHQHWCEIIAVSKDCRYFKNEHVGFLVYVPEIKFNYMWPCNFESRTKKTYEWIVSEDLFLKSDRIGKDADKKESYPPLMVVNPRQVVS